MNKRTRPKMINKSYQTPNDRLNPYLSKISSIRPLGEDEGNTIQKKCENDCKKDTKVTTFVEAAELFKNGINVNWIGCY